MNSLFDPKQISERPLLKRSCCKRHPQSESAYISQSRELLVHFGAGIHEDAVYFTKGSEFSNALSNTDFTLATTRTILLKDLFPACRHTDDASP